MKLKYLLVLILLSLSACAPQPVIPTQALSKPTATTLPTGTKTATAQAATPAPATAAATATAPAAASVTAPAVPSKDRTPVTAPVTAPVTLSSFKWFNAQDAWAVTGGQQHLLLTTDGGQNWQDVTPADQADGIYAAFFLDPQTAWALPTSSVPPPTHSQIYHTVDGGATWSVSEVPFAAASLQFTSPQDGSAISNVTCGQGADGCAFLVYQTSDGGATWTQQTGGKARSKTPAQLTGTVYTPAEGLVVQNASTFWSFNTPNAGGAQSLYTSRDAGQTWKTVRLPAPLKLVGHVSASAGPRLAAFDRPVFLTPQEGFMLWSDDHAGIQVYRSHDGGLTWEPPSGGLALPAYLTDFRPQYATPLDWYVRAADIDNNQTTVLCVTHDGGQTWKILPINPTLYTNQTPQLADYQFIDAKTGWMIVSDWDLSGETGHEVTRLYRSDDGGQSWQPLKYAVSSARPQPALAALPTAPISSFLAITPTPIPTVIATPPAHFPTDYRLHWIDAQMGYAMAQNGHLLRSDDGGQTWQDISPRFKADDQMTYTFLGAQDIWGVENYMGQFPTPSTLFHSADKGQTWQKLPTPFIYGKVTFFDQQTGWAQASPAGCGAGNCWVELYKTSDGGRTWQQVFPPLSFGYETGLQAGSFHILSGQDFTFQNASMLWLSGGYFSYGADSGPVPLLVSQDGGQTWQSKSLHLPPDMVPQNTFPIVFLNNQTGFYPVVFSRLPLGHPSSFSYPYGLVILVTQDGGVTWTPRPPLENGNRPTFVTAQDWFVNCGAQLCLTHDGGQTWQAQAIPGGPENLSQVDFADAQHGWLISIRSLADGNITNALYQTQDGGQTWQPVAPVLK